MTRRIDDTPPELSEINVTPFIDVMLVLLIVFMVAAPLSTVDVAVNLPNSSAPPGERPADPLWLTITAEHEVLLGDGPILPVALGTELDRLSGNDWSTPIFLRADRSIDYGVLMTVLDDLRRAGYLRVALVGLEAGP